MPAKPPPDVEFEPGDMIWAILARYMIALTAGVTWTRAPIVVKVLWGCVLAALIVHDVRAELCRDHGDEASA